MLNGKTAIVTGSTSGIGLAIAGSLAEAGANIVLNGIEPAEQVDPVVQELQEKWGVRVLFDGADMTNPTQIEAMVVGAERAFGSVDIVVNNAGIQYVAPVDEFPIAKWNAIIAINMSSAFHTTRAALPGMKKRGWGRIVNLASAHGLVASPYKSAYVTAKHGVVGLTKTVALEVAEMGITCNAICPGYVRTPLVEKQIPATAEARGISEDEVIRDVMLAAQPTKKFVGTAELGALTVFLCSDAARSLTGAALPVDGGWTAH
ncbi:3-hydroxybutyrate dehydrogenase [uncultured Ruegeria sp.]|uniref:3-hydroxybutyrate dehydrogenase n=1 Tax=uncultured Ruegeria sp. TaxID=259304 RepID=UPI002611425E|nr:3-hydroxybutyrate dehydrogenase [uncultured Ruegeria sp.]